MAPMNRQEKHLMRQRGAGAREMKDATFGFTFDQNSAQRSARKTSQPQPRPRSASSRLTPRPAAGRRSKSKTPASSANGSASLNHSTHGNLPVSKESGKASASLYTTPAVVGKRKRPGAVQEVEEDEADELEKDDAEHRPSSSRGKANASLGQAAMSPNAADSDDFEALEKENQVPEGQKWGKKRLTEVFEIASASEADELTTADADHGNSSHGKAIQKTPAPLKVSQHHTNEGNEGDDPLETPVTYSVEARYIPRKSFEGISKLNLAGKGNATKSASEKKNAAENTKSVKKATKKGTGDSLRDSVASSQAEASSTRTTTEKPSVPTIQRLRAGRPSSSNVEDHSSATIKRNSQQSTPPLVHPKQAPVAVMTTERSHASFEADELSQAASGQLQEDGIEVVTNSRGHTSRLSARAPSAIVTYPGLAASDTEDLSRTAPDSTQQTSFVMGPDRTLADSPADWRPATESISIQNPRRSSSPPRRPVSKARLSKKRKAQHSPQPSPQPNPVPDLDTRSASPPRRARKRSKKASDTVPVTIFRLSQPLRTIAKDFDDSSSDSEDLPSASASASTSTEPRLSNTPNAVDVLAQITCEILSTRAEALHTQSQSLRDKKKRLALERQRNAVGQFEEEVEAQLFTLTEAVDMNTALVGRLRAAEREKVALREELLGVRKKREEVALEMDEVRWVHGMRMEGERERRGLLEGVQDVDVAVRRGREAQLKKGTDGEEDEKMEMAVEVMARQMADTVGKSAESGGLLEMVKRFNEVLEKAAETLEGRND